MTTRELAEQLGVTTHDVRRWMRQNYPRPAADKWARYALTPDQVAAARASWRAHAKAKAPNPYHQVWYWEGNVQRAIVEFLRTAGWQIVTTADAARKARGDDIRAERKGQVLRVEVKGYPAKGRYADPRRSGESKPTNPNLQAGHWYGQALLRTLRSLNTNPMDALAIGLPDFPRYRVLIAETEAPLRRLGIGVYVVRRDGSVDTPIANRNPVHERARRFIDQPGEFTIRRPTAIRSDKPAISGG